jgi:hypothetical protein
MDKPDDIVDNPHSLPYASDRAAPAIRPDTSIAGWKTGAVVSANKHYEDRYNDIKRQFQELVEEFKWNDIMFNAEMRIKPVVGKPYYLYQREDGRYRVSLFAPTETVAGRDGYVGTFRMNYDNRWEVVELADE